MKSTRQRERTRPRPQRHTTVKNSVRTAGCIFLAIFLVSLASPAMTMELPQNWYGPLVRSNNDSGENESHRDRKIDLNFHSGSEPSNILYRDHMKDDDMVVNIQSSSSSVSSSSSISNSKTKFQETSMKNTKNSFKKPATNDKRKQGGNSKLPVLYDSSGIDKEFQLELLDAVRLAFRNLADHDNVDPEYIDLGKIPSSPSRTSSLMTVAHWFARNHTKTAVSLLEPEKLSEFIQMYDLYQKREVRRLRIREQRSSSSHIVDFTSPSQSPAAKAKSSKLKITTPRLSRKNILAKKTVEIFTMQMNEAALCTVLLNRAEKIGVNRLIPILDRDDSSQLEMLGYFIAAGQLRLSPINFAPPIFVTVGESSNVLRTALEDEENSQLTDGFLMLATMGSKSVVEVSSSTKDLYMVRWFSPNVHEYEEWALRGPQNRKAASTYGIFSAQYVGAKGWDNPSRMQSMRDLIDSIEPSPRALSSMLAYDAAWLARNFLLQKHDTQLVGLSGEIRFDHDGYRRDGTYAGISAVAQLESDSYSLLQQSTWIFEDSVTLTETFEGQTLITDHNVATSSMMTREELSKFVEQTINSSNCAQHSMKVKSHDPFNQMPYDYSYTVENLPSIMLIPHHYGYALTFMCRSGLRTDTTMKIDCAPGTRHGDPVICFRTKFDQRHRRDTGDVSSGYNLRSDRIVLNQQGPAGALYPMYNHNGMQQQIYGQYNRRDGSTYNAPGPVDSMSVYGAPGGYTPSPYGGYPGSQTTKFDTVIAVDETTPAPAGGAGGGGGPGGPPKLPELRQVLKAAKPFVGSCVGAATGCAMCVLVLGRLPLGTAPPACTGPCFVGVFGSCGALLGRAFSETTVICSELFRQGYLPMDTYVADAQFGANLRATSPATLTGYHILANPIVKAMKESKDFTYVVSKIAIPWARYMQYESNHGGEFNWLGYFVNLVGVPLCLFVGLFHQLLFTSNTLGIYLDNPEGTEEASHSITRQTLILLLLGIFNVLTYYTISVCYRVKKKLKTKMD